METDLFLRAEQIFHDAMPLSPERRDSFIMQAAGDDSQLASRVRRMIDFAQRASPQVTLDINVDVRNAIEATQGLVGKSLGPYRLMERIGEGGFGAVYRAEQDRPVRRTVALKILKRGMDSDQVIARFEAERQALAMMEHPNIARVFDAGQTDEATGSRLYFVMEFVAGQPITHYCDAHQLDCQERLELFIGVCRAVQHAHQKGIIHRDLKPSNVLVTELDGEPVAKIIDFGIAKAIAKPITAASIVTQRLELLGTPQYMSPEQIDDAGTAIDTRSDIYSLGVMLYELLTGVTPLELAPHEELSYTRIQTMVRDCAIARPSTRVSEVTGESRDANTRMNCDATALRRRLRGDLDWILLKSLESNRERRYASASEFADDIQRHLENRPVFAGPPSTLYRVGKFVRRHRVGVVAAALVMLAVLGGAVGTTFAMLEARDAAEQALAVNEFMHDVLTSADPDSRGADVRLVEVLADASKTANVRFAGHPELEAEVRTLLADVYLRLGMATQRVDQLTLVVKLLREANGDYDPKLLVAQVNLAATLVDREQTTAGEAVLKDLLPRVNKVFGPSDRLTLETQRIDGDIQMLRGQYEEAERLLKSLRQRLLAGGDDDGLQMRILDSLIRIGKHKAFESDRKERHEMWIAMEQLVEERLNRSIRLYGPDTLPTLQAQVRHAEILVYSGEFQRAADIANNFLEATQTRIEKCMGVREHAMEVLGYALHRLGQSREAADIVIQRLDCMRQTSLPNSPAFLGAINDSFRYLERAGRAVEGEGLAREFSAAVKSLGAGHADLTFESDSYLAHFVSMQGRFDEATGLFEQVKRVMSGQNNKTAAARAHLFIGEHLVHASHYEEAERSLQAAVEALGGDVRVGTLDTHPDDVVLGFLALYEAWGREDKVREYQTIRREILSSAISADSSSGA